MRKLFLLPLVAAFMLVFASAASAATTVVGSLSGDFGTTNSSVALASDGVQFGPYADGGSTGGSAFYNGFNGNTLNDIANLRFTTRHNTTDNTSVGVPYLRVFLTNGKDVIFSPNTQPVTQIGENEWNTYNVVGGTVRYDDDCGDGVFDTTQTEDGGCSAGTDTNADDVSSPYGLSGAPWATVMAAHGSDVVDGIYVSAGFSAGVDLSVLLRDLSVNDDTFVLSRQGPDGAVGADGLSVLGPRGGQGIQGVTGSQGPVLRPSETCTGDALRSLTIPNRKGRRFVSARAFLRGASITTRVRAFKVDLRDRVEGNYNVRIVAKYRSKSSGKVSTRTTFRNLSVACS